MEEKKLKKNLSRRNALKLDEEFDLLCWWKVKGERPPLSPHSRRCLHDTQRTFSTYTRTNSNKLRKKLGDDKFKVNILLAAYRAWTKRAESEAKANASASYEEYLKAAYLFFNPDGEWNDIIREIAANAMACDDDKDFLYTCDEVDDGAG